MTQENTNKVNGNTLKAARVAVAKKEISADSFRAIESGSLSLADARELGRNAGPTGPAVRVDKNDRSRDCLCLCGNRTRGGRFIPGHDQRMVTLAKAHVRGEAEPNEEQMAYLVESGKLERAKRRVSEEDRRRAEKEAKKPKK